VKWVKTISLSVFIIVFSGLIGLQGCKDIIFNNPLDPDASKDVVQVIRVIETSLSGLGDIAFDGEKFWKIDRSGILTAFDRETGIVIRSFSVEPGSGVGFFNDLIYFCSGYGGQEENILYTVDPLSGDILNRLPTRELYPRVLTAVDNGLVLFDVRSSGIFAYDPETGDSFRLFEVSGINIGGIAAYKGGLLITDMNTDSIYRFSLSGEVLTVFSSPASGIGGIAADYSDYVYIFMLDGKVYKVSLP
jgi:outer membrane protein assembly factor BamB